MLLPDRRKMSRIAQIFILYHSDRYPKFGAAVVNVCNCLVSTQYCYSPEMNSRFSRIQGLYGDVFGRVFRLLRCRSKFNDHWQCLVAVTAPGRRRTALRTQTNNPVGGASNASRGSLVKIAMTIIYTSLAIVDVVVRERR